jgi:hypothetical protein
MSAERWALLVLGIALLGLATWFALSPTTY